MENRLVAHMRRKSLSHSKIVKKILINTLGFNEDEILEVWFEK